MKSKPKIPSPTPSTINAQSSCSSDGAAVTNGPAHWRHTGNVARLPKAIREKLNQMLEDGLTYPAIIKNLGDDGKGLLPSNISRWKDGGYQDWLLERTWLNQIRSRQETASDLSADFDATQVNHAALQLAALHVFEAMRKLGPGTLDDKLGGDSAAFARLLNALARASRETMLVQKYREACARARAALRELKDPKRKLTEQERRSLVLHVDDILGLASPDDPDPGSAPGGANGHGDAEPSTAIPSPGEPTQCDGNHPSSSSSS